MSPISDVKNIDVAIVATNYHGGLVGTETYKSVQTLADSSIACIPPFWGRPIMPPFLQYFFCTSLQIWATVSAEEHRQHPISHDDAVPPDSISCRRRSVEAGRNRASLSTKTHGHDIGVNAPSSDDGLQHLRVNCGTQWEWITWASWWIIYWYLVICDMRQWPWQHPALHWSWSQLVAPWLFLLQSRHDDGTFFRPKSSSWHWNAFQCISMP